MTNIKLKVEDAKKRDVGRSIVRISKKSMKELNIETGDIISLTGRRKTAAIAWPAYPDEEEKEFIRMDIRIRKNSQAGLGDEIMIEKANCENARSVIIAPTSSKIRSDPYVESFIKRKLLNYPIVKGDIILISIGISKEIKFKVVSTRPSGILIVKNSTIVHVKESMDDIKTKTLLNKSYKDIG
ncbi:MAG: hypothetical protein EU549_02800 [Promethearchaeota archaeon]|nr:MAG: hypothetical protein EU549_02800 [Candidatus Lokiarchaeota archaeon]